MADSAILAAGGDDAPLTYKVPGAAVIRIKQIHVKYTDNSVGSDWLPAVRIISDSSHKMGQASDQAVKVTAGDDADVSFFPGVKHAPASVTPTGSGVAIAEMWFDEGLFSDPFVSIPDNAATLVPFANTFRSDASLFSFSSVVNPNDQLNLRSSTHLYLVSSSSRWNLAGFVQQVALTGAASTVSGGELLGDISLHSVHPADYFNLIQPFAGTTQGQVDWMLVVPSVGGASVQLTAYQHSGGAQNLRRGVLAGVAWALA